MKIILDCNIWISFLIGHQAQLVRKMLTDTRLDIYVCDELKAEIYDVSHRKKIRKYVSRQDIDDLFDIIHLSVNMMSYKKRLFLIPRPKGSLFAFIC